MERLVNIQCLQCLKKAVLKRKINVMDHGYLDSGLECFSLRMLDETLHYKLVPQCALDYAMNPSNWKYCRPLARKETNIFINRCGGQDTSPVVHATNIPFR